MKREIIKIDENLCNGCGACIPNCHEGALQMIDGKARLISDLLCDGLGACIGHCPEGAITMEVRDAEPYSEIEAMKTMAQKGKNTVIAHLQHLKDHDEQEYMKEGINWLKANMQDFSFDVNEIIKEIHKDEHKPEIQISGLSVENEAASCGCAGSAPRILKNENQTNSSFEPRVSSELQQWPVQFHLVNPSAGYFKRADLLLAAVCSAYTAGNFHSDYLKGKSLIIACPKLDSGLDSYLDKLVRLIDEARINTIQVLIMEVPCCGGLLRLVDKAIGLAKRRVPVKATVLNVRGEVLSEEWV